MQRDAPRPPRVEFLWWRECPSWERALSLLSEEMGEAGLDAAAVQVLEVTSDDEARRLGFPGSPTIRIDGRDIATGEAGAQGTGGGGTRFGLTCRVYRRTDGRVSPLPERGLIKAALRAAQGGGRR